MLLHAFLPPHPFRTSQSLNQPFLRQTCAQTPSARATTIATPTRQQTRHVPKRPPRPEAQGPTCPIITRQLLRHCLLCARNRPQRSSAAAQQELAERFARAARKALPVSRGQAEQLYLRTLVADPTWARGYLLYALNVQRRDPKLAREIFAHGIKVQPNDAALLQAWGLFESKYGHIRPARRLIRRSVELEPKNAPVLKWKVIFGENADKKHT